MKNYKFTENWFTLDGLTTLNQVSTKKELHILEIGSFEGKSTIWFLDNILNNENSTITCVDPWLNYSQGHDSLNSYFKDDCEWNLSERKTKEIFLHNIIESGRSEKVIIKEGFSNKVLPSLILENKKYDNWAGEVSGKSELDKGDCYFLNKNYVSVLWNGDIVPCCMDYNGNHIIGNISNLDKIDIKKNYLYPHPPQES